MNIEPPRDVQSIQGEYKPNTQGNAPMDNHNRLTAIRTSVPIGNYEVEGLLIEQKNLFGMQKAKIAEVIDLNPRRISELQETKRGQRLLPKGLVYIGKSVRVVGYNRPLDVLDLNQVQLMWRLAEKDYPKAEELLDILSTVALHQFFADAFNIELTKQNRQEVAVARQEGKVVRRTLTDALADYLARTPELSDPERVFLYANVTNLIYTGLFKRTAKLLRTDWHITKKSDNPRNHMNSQELKWVEQLEDMCTRLIDTGWEPKEAAKEAVKRLIIPVVTR